MLLAACSLQFACRNRCFITAVKQSAYFCLLQMCFCRVKQYEAKLAALNALNSALQKENEQLREDLDEAVQPKTESGRLA